MNVIMTLLAAVAVGTCQNQNDERIDVVDDSIAGVTIVIDKELQKKFEEDAFAAVMKNTRRVTDVVALENAKQLSEIAETRRQDRIKHDLKQTSIKSAEFGEAFYGNCSIHGILISRFNVFQTDIPQLCSF